LREKIIEVIGESTLSGGSTSFLTLVKGLDKKKFDITCICPPGSLAGMLKEVRGVDVEVISMRSKWDFRAVRKIRKLITKLQPLSSKLIVHCHGVRGGWLGRLACIGPRHKAPKVVYSEHLWTREYRLKNPLSYFPQLAGLWFLDLFTDITICVSGAVADFLVDKNITRPDKVIVIYNGIETHKLTSKLKPQTSKVKIGFVGSLVKRKGVEYLIEAIDILSKRYTLNPKLLIIGEGKDKEKLQDLAKKLGLKDKIEFKGLVKNVDAIYPTLDIYVQPSIDESFGIAALEAMSYGLPIIATSVGGLKEILGFREIVSDKLKKEPYVLTDFGIIISPKNSSSIAEAIRHLIKSKKTREKLSKNSQKRAKLFSADNMVKNIEKVYSLVLK